MAAIVRQRWSTDQLIAGIGVEDWWRMLRRNRFRVDGTYLHRAAWVSGLSIGASVLGQIESALYGARIAQTPIDPAPIFVLGHWRSGTTHLHNLLRQIDGHTAPTVFQCIFPGSFLTTSGVVPALTAPLMHETRTYDNVKHGWGEPAEDEIAIAKLTGLSPYVAFMFPDHADAYDRYVDFGDATDAERRRFGEALTGFVRKIMFQTDGQRVVVKSCAHTARIPLLLDLFPDAKFLHIHRHPHEVFASTLHMRSHTDWENFFHLPATDVDALRRDQTLRLGRRIFDRVIADRHLIPEGQYAEIAYSELCGNEVETLARVYDALDLGDFSAARPALERYVSGLSGYKRNRLRLDESTRREVYDRWRPAFDAFGYNPTIT